MTKIGEVNHGVEADLVRTHQNRDNQLHSPDSASGESERRQKACRISLWQIHRCRSSAQPPLLDAINILVLCLALGLAGAEVAASEDNPQNELTPLGSPNSIDDEDGVPVVAIYRDRNRILMGRTYKSSNGDLMARDASHRYVGRYDTSNDITFDSRFRKVGHGNWLPSLIAGCEPNSSQGAN